MKSSLLEEYLNKLRERNRTLRYYREHMSLLSDFQATRFCKSLAAHHPGWVKYYLKLLEDA